MRNLELIRELLLVIEANPMTSVPEALKQKGYTDEEIGFHCYLLGDAGYARVIDVTTTRHSRPQALGLNLTWKGYEFLDAARENSRWTRAKGTMSRVGSASVDVVAELLKSYAKQELGLPA